MMMMEGSSSTCVAMDHAPAWLKLAMDVPVTAPLGPMGPLIRRLYGPAAREQQGRPMADIDTEIQQLVEQGLMEGLFVSLKGLSEAEDASLSFTAKWWMKEVRELCYDAEDHFDEVTTLHYSGAGIAARILLCICTKLTSPPLHIASDISEIMARVKDASKRQENFLLAPNPKITTAAGSAGEAAGVPTDMTGGRRRWCRRMDDLVKLLAFDDESQKQLKVVSIFGLAGVGKTTAARALFDEFGGDFQCRAFLRVSRNPDIRRLLTSILSQIKAPQVRGFPDAQILTASIREHLQDKRFFIVVDDIWTTSVWDIINRAFPDGDCSRVITTTQVKDVALASCSYHLTYRYEMNPLNDDQSAELFFTRVFGSEDCCPADLIEVSYEIISECGGLPLAIVNIASLLSFCLLPDQWKHMQYSLSSALETNPTSEGMKQIIKLTYANLSPHLKTCFLYLSMYPEGYTIRKDELVKQWVAEGFIGERQDKEQTAGVYFDELVSRGMIQPVDTNCHDEVLSCTVHHLVLDFIRYKSMEENFIIIVDNLQTTPGLADKVRRLSVQFGGSKTAEIPENIITSQVRSLLFCGFLKLVPSIVEYRFLRVLILHIWADHDKTSFDLTQIDELLLLRYLKIECNITVKLPAKIRGLRHLETLEVDARLSAVPSDIDCAKSLLHLRLPSDNVLDLDNPTNLQDLHLTCCAGSLHRVVRNMKHLGSILGKCQNLQSLILDDASGSSSMSILCDGLSRVSPSPVHLQRIEVFPQACIFPSLPKWLGQLNSLCVLKIAVRELSKEDMDILKRLPALTAFSLYVGITPAEQIVFDKGFKVLWYFKFTCTALCMAFSEGTMSNVQRLKLRFNADKLEKYDPVRAGFEHLTGLKEISAKIGCIGADESDSKSALMDIFRKHPSRPIFNVQLVDRIIQGDKHKRVHMRVSLPREELSSYPQILGGKKRWRQMNVHLTKTLRGVTFFNCIYAEPLRGVTYLIMKLPLNLGDDLEFIKREMRQMSSIIEGNKEDDLEEEWVPQLQELVYDIEDYICIYSLLRTRLSVHIIPHMSHMKHLKGRIMSIQNWRHADISSKIIDTGSTAMPRSFPGTSPRCYVRQDDLIGIENPRDELLQLLIHADDRQPWMISIVGCRGSGKSTLAAVVYNDHRVCQEFDGRAWVVASECRNSGDLLDEIFQQLDPENKTTRSIYGLTCILQDRRCLVVIDQAERGEIWYDISRAFPPDSRIIVTTSVQSVVATAAGFFSSHSYIYAMQGLGDADSRKLFWRKVYGFDTEPAPALVDGSASIFKKCDGLPLALVSVANYVREHHQGGRIQRFGTNYQEAFGQMNRVFVQCFNSLPDNGHRTCLLSLSIFPHGHQINRKSVIRRWIAEGLVAGNAEHTAEEVAAARFSELINRSIIEPVLIGNNSKVKRCRVNGAMLEFVVNKAISKNFATLIRKDEPVSYTNPHPIRRLSVQGDGGTTGSGSIATGIGLSFIRSLTINNSEAFDFQRSKLLRVLDLERCKGLDDIVLDAVCQLLILKYLSLRGSDVRKIPKRIRRLRHLETLDIRGTKVNNLPMEAMMLPRLVHLFGRFELPEELRYEMEKSKLQKFLSEESRLQTLSGFVMEKNGGLESIVLHMSSLRKVKIWCKRYPCSTSAIEYDVSSIQKLFAGSNNALESISIDSDSYPTNFLHSLQGPCRISSIKLRGTLLQLPKFLSSVDSTLSELQLSFTGLSCEELSVLQNLRCLLYLKLSEVRQGLIGGIFEVRSGGFPSLERLCLEAPMLPEVHIKQGAMNNLTSLRLLCLPEYAGWRNVKGIEHLHRLKEVVLHHSVDAVGLEAWKQTAVKHENRPKVSREVVESIIPW
ncbi:uncharacterized protein LOC112272497 isoform X2 [Brachypodium distachyon]|nr:uncharacterized protein LOC112272497 isoform X2 [Brachypodium distachyon]|eukprot:XP_024319280.1 uncharacterized protein LOC112272497 isoform X2 [Brachypodium distachyon]